MSIDSIEIVMLNKFFLLYLQNPRVFLQPYFMLVFNSSRCNSC